MLEIPAYISLGSNLDDPLNQVTTAISELDNTEGCKLDACSSLYRSAPMGPQDQPEYINAVALLRTRLSAEELLDALQAIELAHQRVRTRHWGPRTLDLDILIYGNALITTDRLRVPHPGIAERSFVLYPLAELEPELMVPGAGAVEDLLFHCSRSGLEKIK